MDDSKLRESKSRATKVVIGSVVMIAAVFGSLNCLSNYVASICMELGASVVEVSIMFSIAMIMSTLGGLVAAVVIDRVKPRLLTFIGAACFILFFLFLYFGNNLAMIYVGTAFLGLATVFAGFTICQSLITWWNIKNVGKKISACSVGMNVFVMILSPTLGILLVNIGFKDTVAVQGVVLSILMLIAVIFFISNKPESYGLKPYGYEEGTAAEAAPAEDYVPDGLTVKQALKTWQFWVVALCALLVMIPSNGFVSNGAMIFQSLGFDTVGAATMIAVFSACGLVWVFMYGAINDKLGAKKTNAIFVAIAVVALLLVILIGGQVGAIILAATFGTVTAMAGMLVAMTCGSLFGHRAIGTLISLALAISGIGSMLSAPIGAMINEATGGYMGFLVMFIVVLLVIIALLFLTTSKSSVEKLHKIAESNKQ